MGGIGGVSAQEVVCRFVDVQLRVRYCGLYSWQWQRPGAVPPTFDSSCVKAKHLLQLYLQTCLLYLSLLHDVRMAYVRGFSLRHQNAVILFT